LIPNQNTSTYTLKRCSKNVANNVDMSSLKVPWQNGTYKNQHTEQHKNMYNTKTQQTFRKKLLFCDFRICRVHTSSAVSKYIPDIRDDSVLDTKIMRFPYRFTFFNYRGNK